MLTRRTFLSDVVLALAAAGCSPSGSRDDRSQDSAAPVTPAPESQGGQRLKLTAQTNPVLCYVDWAVADHEGFFAAEGLDVEFLGEDTSQPHGHGLTSAWLRGSAGPVRADLMVLEYSALPDLVSGALDYYIVAGEHSGCRQLVVPVNSPIRTVTDLRGKRIGTIPVGDPLIWEYLIGRGPGSQTVQWVRHPFPGGDPQELLWVKREFAARRIDAYISPDPVGEILKAEGVARLVASNTWTPPLNGWYCCMLAVRKELVEAYPDLAKSVTRAIRRAAAFVEEKPAEAVALAVVTGHLPASTRQDLGAKLLSEYVWTATGRIEEDLERYFQLLIDAGRIPITAPPRELVKRVYRSGE